MSDYEVIFGLDCVGGDQAPIDCAVVKTIDGKPGIMLDGEVFTKESLTPPINKLPLVVGGDEVELSAEDLAGATSIRDHAFYVYHNLTSVTIPDSVTSIGDNAFFNCSGLTSVTIPYRVTNIGNYAFYDCTGLTSVTIGSGVTSIGSWAFENDSNITTFRILATTPPTASYIFGGNSSQGYVMPPCLIYVPEESVEDYKDAWSSYAAYIEADPN